jgi:solute carrier family 25 thiamine pyrophosphate transporter 19
MVSAPFDVLKIRMQLSTGAISFSKVSGLECFVELARLAERIARTEGLLAFWAGNVPALQLYGAYNAVQFGAFGALKSSLAPVVPSPFLVGFLAGSTAGVLATVATFPLDVLRTRGAALGVRRKEHTIAHAVSEATRQPWAKVRDLYRGLSPAVCQIMPLMGLNFAIYESLRSLMPTDRFSRVGLYGAISGTVSKLCVYPLDLAKKRLQMQGVQISEKQARFGIARVPAYRNLAHCLVSICRSEGLPGLFRGVLPGLIKAAPASGASFLAYDAMRVFLRDDAARMTRWIAAQGPHAPGPGTGAGALERRQSQMLP